MNQVAILLFTFLTISGLLIYKFQSNPFINFRKKFSINSKNIYTGSNIKCSFVYYYTTFKFKYSNFYPSYTYFPIRGYGIELGANPDGLYIKDGRNDVGIDETFVPWSHIVYKSSVLPFPGIIFRLDRKRNKIIVPIIEAEELLRMAGLPTGSAMANMGHNSTFHP